MFVQCVYQDGTKVNVDLENGATVANLRRELKILDVNRYRYFYAGQELSIADPIPEAALCGDGCISVVDSDFLITSITRPWKCPIPQPFERFRMPLVDKAKTKQSPFAQTFTTIRDPEPNFLTSEDFLANEYRSIALQEVTEDSDEEEMRFMGFDDYSSDYSLDDEQREELDFLREELYRHHYLHHLYP